MKHLILLNLGSPEGGPGGPSAAQVRTYLAEFLMDPRVIDLPWLARWLLVHGIILRTRPRKSAEAYSRIWSPRGSPLRFHLDDLVSGVQARLGAGWKVSAAMRYGQPSIAEAVNDAIGAHEVEELVVFPLYPQFALATTESSIEAVRAALAAHAARTGKALPPVRFVPQFYDAPEFLEAAAPIARRGLGDHPWAWDHVLFTFHGLPLRQVERQKRLGYECYREQCLKTASLLARGLGLADGAWSVSFQSRLGSSKWLRPFTDEVLAELGRGGTKRVAVICPAFVSDCVETLEEIGMRGAETFRASGGGEFQLVPSLNSEPEWATAVARLAEKS